MRYDLTARSDCGKGKKNEVPHDEAVCVRVTDCVENRWIKPK